jgi:hypothetical protein
MSMAPTGGTSPSAIVLWAASAVKASATTTSTGRSSLSAADARIVRALSSASVSTNESPIATPRAAREGVAHPPPTSKRSARGGLSTTPILSEILAPAQDGDERVLSPSITSPQIRQLLLHQQARHGRQQVRHTFGRGVRPVSRSKGIVNVDGSQARQALRQRRVILGFAALEAGVLEHERFPG